MPQDRCRHYARHGEVYNPFKKPPTESEPSRTPGGVGGEPPTAMAAPAAASSSGAVLSAPQVSGYGDLGARLIEPAS